MSAAVSQRRAIVGYRAGDETTRATLPALIILLSFPFIQFGLTYWISVQGLLFWLTIITLNKNISGKQALIFLAIALVMLLSLLGHLYADGLFYALLRVLRHITAILIIICAASGDSYRSGRRFFDVVLPCIIISLSGLVIIQYVTYTLFGWSELFAPANWFISGQGTNADRTIDFAADRGFVAVIRAAGPFSEPSYFGFVSLALSLLLLKGVPDKRRQLPLLALLLIALFCSKSASGVIAFSIFVLYAYRSTLAPIQWVAIFSALAIALAVASELLDFHLVERLLNVADPILEPSGYVRLVLPLQHIALVLEHKPFGVPLSEFFLFTSNHIAEYTGTGALTPVGMRAGGTLGTDNGLFNLIIAYGVGSFVIMGLIFFAVKDKLAVLFLLLAAQFNGDVLAPDKVVVIALVLGAMRVYEAKDAGTGKAMASRGGAGGERAHATA